MVVKMLTCGHEKKVMCHKDVSDSDIQCQENILKSLNCGHRKIMHCFVDLLSVKCNEMTVKVLPCSHQQETECWRKVDEIKCNTKVDKILPCGHNAFAFCFQSPNEINCEENVSKQLPHCCHTMWMKCYLSPNKIKCVQQVEFIQPTCNHINQIACHVNKSLQENEKMKPPQCTSTISRIELCGHEVTNPCINPSKNICRKKCTAELACGHKCTGDCQKCKGGLFHEICAKNCTSNFVCGHKCIGKHCGNCKPCEDKCTSTCSHITCEKICSRPCSPCEKPCDWSCPHFTCELPCYEPCKRPRCNIKCPKILQCGHKCAGFCGEPCIKTCLQCKNDDDSKHLLKTGLVQLSACGHIFPAYELDAAIEAQTISILHALRCPSCHTIIPYHPRYNEILKKRANLLNMIKIQIQRQNPVVTFPTVFGDGKKCSRYVTEFGTFLSATKRKLEKGDENDLKRVQFYLEIIQVRLSSDELHSYQTVIDIYDSIEVLSWKWKTLILKLAKNDIIEGLTVRETPSETSIKDEHVSKVDGLQTPGDIEERFCLLGQLDSVPIDIFISKQHEIKSFISNIKPLLSSQVNTRIEKADNFPKPSGYMDCHIDRWSVCENGHPFYDFDHKQACSICHHVEFKHPFVTRPKPSHDFNQKGARPKQLKQAQNKDSLSKRNTNGSNYSTETRKTSELASRYEGYELNIAKSLNSQDHGKHEKGNDLYPEQTESPANRSVPDDFESMIRDITRTDTQKIHNSSRGSEPRTRGKGRNKRFNHKTNPLSSTSLPNEFMSDSNIANDPTSGQERGGRGRGNQGYRGNRGNRGNRRKHGRRK